MATNSNTRKYLIWGSVSVLTITGGVFLFRWLKQRDEDHKNVIKDLLNKLIDKKPNEDTTTTPPPSNTSEGSGSSSFEPKHINPFSSKQELKDFQQWVIDVKKDKSILGKGGADGLWGTSSSNAYDKYGAEYAKKDDSIKETPKADTISESLKKDIDFIMLLADKGAPKAKESYLKSVAISNEDYVRNWAKALRARVEDPKKGTTFPFGSKIYESYTGEIASATANSNNINIGKNVAVWGTDARLRIEPKWDSDSRRVSNGYNLGEVKAFFYNNKDKALFAYIPNNNYSGSWKWIHASQIKNI